MKMSANIDAASVCGALAVLAAAIALPGCASGSRPIGGGLAATPSADPDTSGLLSTASTATVVADWNDIDASVEYAEDESELAVLESNPPASDRRVFILRSILDEPCWLVITRSPAPAAAGNPGGGEPPVLMTLRCTVGRFGNPAWEERFLRVLTARLAALKGVEFRPL